MKIYSKENGICDFFDVHIHFPFIAWVRKFTSDSLDEMDNTKRLTISLHTGIVFEKSCNHWHFSLKILGFGVSVTRQFDF